MGTRRTVKAGAAALVLLAAAAATLNAGPASAVTYGTPVTNAAKATPWVVRVLWASPGASSAEASLLCSGSLINSTTVITAGHCVDDSSLKAGFYYVQAAGTADTVANRVPVDTTWYNPDFNMSELRGDVSLLHLTRPIKLKQYSVLASNPKVPSTLHLYGYGENEAAGLPNQLWTTTMHPAGASYIKVLDNYNIYDPTTMLAAVNYSKTAGVFSGGCHGDSGGPLIAYIKNRPVQYGVVSWGQPSCVGTASVFARVTSLRSAIADGVSMLPSLVKTTYRGRPELVKAPTITGWTGSSGATLTCHAGSWTNHLGSVAYRWYTQDSVPGNDAAAGSSQTYIPSATDVKYPVQCVVLAYSQRNSSNYNVATATVNARVRPVIESVTVDVGTGLTRSVGSVWTCNAAAGGIYPITSLSQAARTFTWTAENGAVLPHIKHLVWTQALINAVPNGTLVTCTIRVMTAQSGGVASTNTSPGVVAN